MSQEKVDKYKEQKTKRKENAEKARRRRRTVRGILIAVAVVVAAGLATAIGFTIRNQYIKYVDSRPDYTSDTSLIVQDMSGILSMDDEEDEDAEEDEAEDEADEEAEDEAAEE